jgi:hypothetical protein
MARNYGVRYLTVDEFVKYCAELKVETDLRELEYYEKIGIILPVARVIYPEEYIRLQTLWSLYVIRELPHENQWPDLQRLFDRHRSIPEKYADLSDEELIDSFDRAMGKNSYLIRPTPENYKPWDTYTISIAYGDGLKTSKSIAEHRYSYWQVHQLYHIQQYPDLYKNKRLLDHIPDEIKQRYYLPSAPSQETLREFNGLAPMFDLLSFWITVYERERKRVFALVPPTHQVKKLGERQYQEYLDRLKSDAELVQTRYGKSVNELYQYLSQLLELQSDYRKKERYKLAEELRNDIIFLAHLIELLTNNDWEEVADELGKRSTPWTRQNFRYLDLLIKERDEARDILIGVSKKYDNVLKSHSIVRGKLTFPSSDIDEMLDYCKRQSYTVLFTSLGGMTATEEEYAEKFRPVARYTNLRNILTALEFVMRDFALKAGSTKHRLTLSVVIEAVMKNEAWFSLYEQKDKKKLTSANSEAEFSLHLNQLLHDPDLVQSEETFWARVFLIASLARNLTAHDFPTDDWFYGELYVEMLEAGIYAILYSWQSAKSQGWV